MVVVELFLQVFLFVTAGLVIVGLAGLYIFKHVGASYIAAKAKAPVAKINDLTVDTGVPAHTVLKLFAPDSVSMYFLKVVRINP